MRYRIKKRAVPVRRDGPFVYISKKHLDRLLEPDYVVPEREIAVSDAARLLKLRHEALCYRIGTRGVVSVYRGRRRFIYRRDLDKLSEDVRKPRKNEVLLTEAARIVGVNRHTLSSRIRTREVSARRAGGRTFINKKDIDLLR